MEFSLNANIRKERGKEKIKKLRFNNSIPAVIYGKGYETKSLTLNAHDFLLIEQKIGTRQPLVHLFIAEENKTEKVIPKIIQYHPVTRRPIHVDFFRPEEKQLIIVPVPIKQLGAPVGVIKQGAVLLKKRFNLLAKVSINEIPDYIEIDTTELEVGQTIYTEDLEFDNIVIANPPRTPIFSVQFSKVATETTETEEETDEEDGETPVSVED